MLYAFPRSFLGVIVIGRLHSRCTFFTSWASEYVSWRFCSN